jgi:hypothetical protein
VGATQKAYHVLATNLLRASEAVFFFVRWARREPRAVGGPEPPTCVSDACDHLIAELRFDREARAAVIVRRLLNQLRTVVQRELVQPYCVAQPAVLDRLFPKPPGMGGLPRYANSVGNAHIFGQYTIPGPCATGSLTAPPHTSLHPAHRITKLMAAEWYHACPRARALVLSLALSS